MNKKPKTGKCFTYWWEGNQGHFAWYKEGVEVRFQVAIHGMLELRNEFLANGYKRLKKDEFPPTSGH